MKHSFQNLNIALKKTSLKIHRNISDLENDVEDYFISFNDAKKAYNTFLNKHLSFTSSIKDANAHSLYGPNLERKQIERLTGLVLDSDLMSLDKSKDWYSLLDLLEDGYASKLQKEQKDWDKHIDTFQSKVKTSLGITKDLYNTLN